VSAARVVDERHPPSAAPARTARRLQARYTRPWLAHASIGPSCALARWADDGGEQPVRLEVWTHSQGIFGLRRDLALAFGLAEAEVRVQHVPGAGCYGHNGADDVAFDAAWLARRVPGRPVRCEWSRADDLARAPLGPAMCVELSAEVDEAGCVRHWQHELWSPGHSSRPGRSSTPALLGHAQRDGGEPLPDPIDMPLEVGGGAERNAVPGYAFEAWRIVAHRVRAPWRSSALRSLGALGNVFAAESFIDEVARATGRDPLAWRDELLAHDPRGQAVLRAVAARAGWNTDVAGEAAPGTPRAGQPGERVEAAEASGRGIGYARYKLTGAWCAVVAEVEVRRLVIAADIGHVVDAEGASMQLEGAAIQATGFALKEAVEPGEDGRLPPAQADSVPMLGFTEVPEVEVVLLPSTAPSLGAGEAAVGPTVAAIANALTDALGVRVRDLPLTRARIVAAIQEQEG
jgi:CO/xanthine dehydrogenase Mo-binding subunit